MNFQTRKNNLGKDLADIVIKETLDLSQSIAYNTTTSSSDFHCTIKYSLEKIFFSL